MDEDWLVDVSSHGATCSHDLVKDKSVCDGNVEAGSSPSSWERFCRKRRRAKVVLRFVSGRN